MNTPEQTIQSIKWQDNGLYLLDQRLLPNDEVYLRCGNAEEVAKAIREMVVRGAPAIGIAAAYAVVLSAQTHLDTTSGYPAIIQDMQGLGLSRPTAINLDWALARMKKKLDSVNSDLVAELLREAEAIHAEDIAANLHIGRAGANLLQGDSRILTHCNAGALATGGYGTALGVIRSAWETGKLAQVYADETRPWLQGSRLTAWELQREGIPTTLLCEGAAASLMRQGKVDWVVVGADRIVANGDVANKIGTYSLAVLARQHGVNFMVAAPTSTVDMSITKGCNIPIEQRSSSELFSVGQLEIGIDGVEAWNPVFDITPSELIDYIVTETSVVAAPNKDRMRAAFR